MAVDNLPPDFDENPEWTRDTDQRAKPADQVHPPQVVAALVRKRKSEVVTLDLDEAVIEKFRATGKGWQARINATLRDAEIGRDETEADAA